MASLLSFVYVRILSFAVNRPLDTVNMHRPTQITYESQLGVNHQSSYNAKSLSGNGTLSWNSGKPHGAKRASNRKSQAEFAPFDSLWERPCCNSGTCLVRKHSNPQMFPILSAIFFSFFAWRSLFFFSGTWTISGRPRHPAAHEQPRRQQQSLLHGPPPQRPHHRRRQGRLAPPVGLVPRDTHTPRAAAAPLPTTTPAAAAAAAAAAAVHSAHQAGALPVAQPPAPLLPPLRQHEPPGRFSQCQL